MKKIALLCRVLLFALLGASNSFSEGSGRTLYVNNKDPACGGKSPCYTTIQAAVTAAFQGDRVQVQAGTYREQLTIDGRNNFAGATETSRLVIEADPALPPGNVTLRPPPASCLNGQGVLIRRSKFVTLRGLTITGAVGAGVVLLGGPQQNQAIHIERSRIFGNSSSNCPGGGIAVALGNPDTLILNTLIYGNGGNGITFADPGGGPHWVIQNTIHENGWNGVGVVLGQTVTLANNLITRNGQASGALGGRYGISRIALPGQSPEAVRLLNNVVCGNRLGEIQGPVLDNGDSGNLTPQGTEGTGVNGSPGCQLPANVYADVNGVDGLANTADDDFFLADGSPAIDRGMDPRSLGLHVAFDVLFEADFDSEFIRPSDSNGDRILAVDIGALEVPNEPPIADAEPDQTTFRGALVTLNGNRSYDREGAALTYRWSILSQPPNSDILLSNPISATQQFTPLVRGIYLLQLVVNDGQLDSAPDTVRVNVINSVPTASGFTITVNEDTSVNITVSAVDLDDTNLGFTIVSGPGSGMLGAMSTPSCVANGVGSICTATVMYTPAASFNGLDRFTFKANDASADSNIATVSITVSAVNDMPVANNATATTNEGTPVSVTLSASDIDSSSLTLTIAGAPDAGTVGAISTPNCVANGAGSICTATVTYTPAANFNGVDSFTFKANDGSAESNVATVSLTIRAVNDAPVADNAAATTNEDTPVNISLSGSDIDSTVLRFTIINNPGNGTLGSISMPDCMSSGAGVNCTVTVTYTPIANFSGLDSFTYKVNDGTANSNEAMVSLTVSAINDAPVATDDFYNTGQDTPLNWFAPGVLANDNDIDTPASALTVTLVTEPSHALFFTLNSDGSFSYTPAANFSGTDSFTYQVNDGTQDSNIATVTVGVNAVNDAPVATNDFYTTAEDTPRDVPARGVLANDNDINTPIASITAVLVTGPTHAASFTLNEDGSFSYTPTAKFNGRDSFTYKANDGSTDSNVAMVTIAVNPVNDSPVAQNDTYTVAEDSVLGIVAPGVLENDGNLNSHQTLSADLVSGPAHAIAFQLNADGSFSHTPVADFNGVDTFTYRFFDGAAYSNIAMAQITVINVNDAPIAQSQSLTTNENTPVIISLNASDNDSASLSFNIVAGSGHGTLTANQGAMSCTPHGRGSTCTANVSYTPASNYSGPDNFAFTVGDGIAMSAVATISIAVVHVNRPPLLSPIGNKTVTVGNTLAFTVNATDPENDPLIYSVSPLPLPANASFDTSARVFTFTPAASQVESFSLTFAVSDGKGGTASETILITVLAGLSINIASPANGATVPSGLVIVRGAVDAAGTDVGVNVNGFTASVNAGQWVVQLSLNPGVQSLTATASTIAGRQATHTIAVNVSAASGGGVVLSASLQSGVAPLTVSWLLSNQTGRNLVAFEFDENGRGMFGQATSSFDGVQTTYATAGLYLAVLRATDEQGDAYTATAVVNVEDPLVVRTRFQGVWTSLKDRLLAGDIEGALNHLAPAIRPRFETVFRQLGADLPTIAAGFGDIEVLEQLDDIAETLIVQQENNSPMLYFIYYRRDILGRWLIEEM